MASAATSERFPKALRLRVRREFLRVQRRGHRIFGKRFIYQFIESRYPHNRLGITVSRKVGNAVARNRIKRWVREVYRRHPALHERNAKGSHLDIVVTAKHGATDFTFDHVRDELTHVIPRFLASTDLGPPRRRRRDGSQGR